MRKQKGQAIAIATIAFLVSLLGLAGTVHAQCDPCGFLEDATGNGFDFVMADGTVSEVEGVYQKYGGGADVQGGEHLLNNSTGWTFDTSFTIAVAVDIQQSSQADENIIGFYRDSDDHHMFALDYPSSSEERVRVKTEACDGDRTSGDVIAFTATNTTGLRTWVVEYDRSGDDTVTIRENGTLILEETLGKDACLSEADDIRLGYNPDGSGRGDIYEARHWDVLKETDKTDAWADPESPEFDHELMGDESAAWFLEEGVAVGPFETPEPVDFAQGIRNAAAAWGFRTNESQMFFAIAVIGMATVATGSGLKIMRSGRNKNLIIAGVGFALGVFFVLVRMIDFWMLTVATILGAFVLMGGPREARNTFEDIVETAREEASRIGLTTGTDATGAVVEETGDVQPADSVEITRTEPILEANQGPRVVEAADAPDSTQEEE